MNARTVHSRTANLYRHMFLLKRPRRDFKTVSCIKRRMVCTTSPSLVSNRSTSKVIDPFCWPVLLTAAMIPLFNFDKSIHNNNNNCDCDYDCDYDYDYNVTHSAVDDPTNSKEILSATTKTPFPFYNFLLEQLQVVKYSEDRDAQTITSDSGRNKPTGLVGLACIHCINNSNSNGNSNNSASRDDDSAPNRSDGNEKESKDQSLNQDQNHSRILSVLDSDASIFPQDRRSLAREVSTKMYHHVSNCPHCPSRTRQELQRLHDNHHHHHNHHHKKNKKQPNFGREERLFFRELWYEMGHKDMDGNWKKGNHSST